MPEDDPLRARLAALVANWRTRVEQYRYLREGDRDYAAAMAMCATELEAALRAASETERVLRLEDELWNGKRAVPAAAPRRSYVREHEEGREDPEIAARVRQTMQEINNCVPYTRLEECPSLFAFGPIYRAIAEARDAGPAAAPQEEAAFKAGWRVGYSDAGDHDCRMFKPTADRAWEDFLQAAARAVPPEGR